MKTVALLALVATVVGCSTESAHTNQVFEPVPVYVDADEETVQAAEFVCKFYNEQAPGIVREVRRGTPKPGECAVVVQLDDTRTKDQAWGITETITEHCQIRVRLMRGTEQGHRRFLLTHELAHVFVGGEHPESKESIYWAGPWVATKGAEKAALLAVTGL
jgi:hypothetical protein